MIESDSTEIVAIRHGQTEWNVERRFQGHMDSPLTALGLRQAVAVAESFGGETVDAIYSSDLGRAMRTAEAVAEVTGAPVFLEKRLRELHYGILEGRTADDFRAGHPEVAELFFARRESCSVPGGETLRERHDRVVAFFEEVAASAPGGRLVVITHGGVLDSLFRHVVGLDLAAPRRFELPNGGRNVVERRPDGWRLRAWGDTRHLNGLRSRTFVEG